MKKIYYILTIPLLAVSEILLIIRVKDILETIDLCLSVIDVRKHEIPDVYVKLLKAAEDHRSECHYGVDHLAILRAMFVFLTRNKIQGASTIEQQFVRVISVRYEKTIVRKLREQILSVLIASRRDKSDIAKAYLAVAYYGNSLVGTLGIQKILDKEIHKSTEEDAASIVSRLKYPEPTVHSKLWKSKINQRIEYVKSRS